MIGVSRPNTRPRTTKKEKKEHVDTCMSSWSSAGQACDWLYPGCSNWLETFAHPEVPEHSFVFISSNADEKQPELLCKMERGEELYVMDAHREEKRDACVARTSGDWGGSGQAQGMEEPHGCWSPPPPRGQSPWGPESHFIKMCTSWCAVQLTDVRSVLQGPLEGGRNALEMGVLICSECGKTFENRDALSEHQALHEEEQKAPLACTSCGKTFRHRRNLMIHKKHRGKSRHTCSQCGILFCLKGDLLRHRADHAAESFYPCDACGLIFHRKRHLLIHKKEHDRKTLHKFPSNVSLVAHSKLHQRGRPFSCLQCGRSFRFHEKLLQHQTSHTAKEIKKEEEEL
ncbi:hypothetical protein lerEdw1_020433 [Lerista edwardsae]|nr:hypothetical protein lerEdw1_020433 [Lerista edwardsae]